MEFSYLFYFVGEIEEINKNSW